MKKDPQKICVLQGEFIRRERNTSSIPQMWSLDNLSPKFTINPENNYTQQELQQQVCKENILFTEGEESFCISLVKRRAFLHLHKMMNQSDPVCVISEIMSSLQRRHFTF